MQTHRGPPHHLCAFVQQDPPGPRALHEAKICCRNHTTIFRFTKLFHTAAHHLPAAVSPSASPRGTPGHRSLPEHPPPCEALSPWSSTSAAIPGTARTSTPTAAACAARPSVPIAKAAEAQPASWERDAADPENAARRDATLGDALKLLLRTSEENRPAPDAAAQRPPCSTGTRPATSCESGPTSTRVTVPYPLLGLHPRESRPLCLAAASRGRMERLDPQGARHPARGA